MRLAIIFLVSAYSLDIGQPVLADALSLHIPVRAPAGTKCSQSLSSSKGSHLEAEDLERVKVMHQTYNRAQKDFQKLPFESEVLNLFEFDVRFENGNEQRALEQYLIGSQANLALRGHHDTFFRQVEVNQFKDLISGLDPALMRLIQYKGVCFRGESIEAKELENLKIGDVIDDLGYKSASLSLLKASSFNARFSGLVSVIFVILSDSGRVVPRSLYHRKEWEIIFPRRTSTKVLKILESGFDNKPVIFVREEPNPDSRLNPIEI